MDIRMFYSGLGADYNNVLNRLGSEALIKKYLTKFSDDDSFSVLQECISTQNYTDAFRAAHTMKGVCLNLELTPLSALAAQLTEQLRGYTPFLEAKLHETLKKTADTYSDVLKRIKELQ